MKTMMMICMAVATLMLSGCKHLFSDDSAVSANIYGGGISPKIGPYLAWGSYEWTPDKVFSIRYTRKITTSVFDSKSHDITESLFVMSPSTNFNPDVAAIVASFGPAPTNASTLSIDSTTNRVEVLP